MRAILLLFLAACTERETVVMPEPPVAPNVRSLIIVFEGQTTFAYALALESPSRPLLEVEAPGWTDDRFTAVAFGFDRPLSFYDLTSGLLGPIDGPRSCALGTPIAAASYQRGEQTWREADPIDHPSLVHLADASMYGCISVDMCRRFRSEVVELPSTENVHLLLPVEEETALVALRRGRFFEVSRTGLTERTDLQGLPSDSGVILPSGEIWLAGDGKIARGTRSGPFEQMPVPDSAGETLAAIAVEEEEALLLGIADLPDVESATITLHRFAAGAWTIVERRIESSHALRQSDIHWVGDQALVIFGGTLGWVWDRSRITTFPLPSPIPLFEPHLNDIAARADFGTVIGANDGFLYRLESGPTDWAPIRPAILGNGIKGVGSAYEGFLFGGPDGIMNQYYPGSIECTSERLARSDAELIQQLGEAVLVSGGNPRGREPNTLTWLYE